MSLTIAQLEIRKGRIGSTDIAAIAAYYRPELAHLAKKKNATDVWLRLVHGVDLTSRGVMTRGTRMEPILRELYRSSVGPCSDEIGTIIHPAHPWACASPDGLADEIAAVVEIKTCSNWVRAKWGDVGTDKVPDDYAIQCQWMMEAFNGRTQCVVLVAFGDDVKPSYPPAPEEDDGSDIFRVTDTAVYRLQKDEELCRSLIEMGGRFMTDFVNTKTPPPDLAPLWNKRKFKAILKEQK